MRNAASKIFDKLPKLKVSFAKLSKQDVLVGVPRDETNRNETGEMTNATLAFIHDRGSPAANIPARPFMVPGIENAKKDIVRQFSSAARTAMSGNDKSVVKALHASGLLAQSSIRAVINAGIAPPLAASTLRSRIRSGKAIKGAKAELAARASGSPAGMENAKPLVQTAQLRNSINYVVRSK